MNLIVQAKMEEDKSVLLSCFDSDSTIPAGTIVTIQKMMDGTYSALSFYGDEKWLIPDAIFPPGTLESNKILNFSKLKNHSFIAPLKLAMSRFYFIGRLGYKRPKGGTLVKVFRQAVAFLNYLTDNNITRLSEVSSLIGAQYVSHCKSQPGLKGQYSSPISVSQRLLPVEALHELLQKTSFAFRHPWPDSTANYLAGVEKTVAGKTLIIPDDIVRSLMQKSVSLLKQADSFIDYRDAVQQWREDGRDSKTINNHLAKNGYKGGVAKLTKDIYKVRQACTMIIFITTGIRAHELLSLESGCCYTTLNDDYTRHHWIKGVSNKTGEGATEWLCPEICHQAVAVLERIALPTQSALRQQIECRKLEGDSLMATKQNNHRNRLFLSSRQYNLILTRGTNSLNIRLKSFVLACGIDWNFSSHQCRRTFAVYVVRNALGDLRYLRDHYKHWSLDMTVMYATNEAQDEELYGEIYLAMCDAKTAKVKHWLDPDTPLSGGMAKSIKIFRSKGETVRTYKTQADMVQGVSDTISLRATGVAWCTADQGGCNSGKGIDKTKCGDCSGSIIDDTHQSLWEAIYIQQLELVQLEDIGEAGMTTAKHALKRCKQVLTDLGADINRIREVAANGC